MGYEESVESSEFLTSFADDIKTGYDLKDVPNEDIVSGFNTILSDGTDLLSEQEVKEHIEFMETLEPKEEELIKEFTI